MECIRDPEIATYEFDEIEKNGWIAQVRVARAFYYLQLIKRYGGVPLIDTPYETNHDFLKISVLVLRSVLILLSQNVMQH